MKTVVLKFDSLSVTQEKLDDIFNFVFNKIAEYEALDNSKLLSDTYNNLGEHNNE